ncbi:Succinate dehydrogenase [Pseudohongiella spirulinae]|uniref:Succinate dehydrogenase cytochrome b556 subunit n=1 Tax=Pseudohongiella spirulinae TaxID=1249552 RepID=A0A0S2KDS2_9GAMM|nr:Succinate dehydrogenase [Pseudohongiella spirulinae]
MGTDLKLTEPIPGPNVNWLPVKDNRPVNLDLSKFHFPLPAITSILHRISGVLIFAGTAVLLWMLAESLSSPQGYERVSGWLDTTAVKVVVWAILSGLLYHLIAGIRHLLMDAGIGETLEGGRRGAVLIVVFAVISIVLAGVWVW